VKGPTISNRLVAGLFLGVIALVAVWSAASGVAAEDVSLVPCLVRKVTHMPCPGCGITRASVALVQGDLHTAWHYHPFAFLLIPLALGFLFVPRQTQAAWGAMSRRTRRVTTSLLLALCLGLWASRVF
jgi:hypothetical protein